MGANPRKRTYVGPHHSVTVVLAIDGRSVTLRQGESVTDLSADQAKALDAQEGIWKDPVAEAAAKEKAAAEKAAAKKAAEQAAAENKDGGS